MDKITKNLVSICIPAFNGASLIHRALESALHQSYENIEIIVTDDASTDNTGEIVKRYAARDNRVRYFKNDINLGGQKNLFRAVELASGKYIQGLCQDDWLSQNYIEEAVKNFNLYPDTAGVFSGVICLNLKDGNVFNSTNASFKPKTKNFSTKSFLKDGYGSYIIWFGDGFPFYRKEDLMVIKPFIWEITENPNYRFAREAGFWGESLIPLKILSKYETFTCTGRSAYIKVIHPENNVGLDRVKFPQRISERVALSAIIRGFYERIYRNEAKVFLGHFRVDFGAREINDIFVSLLKGRFKNDSLKNLFKEGVSGILRDYSLLERIMVIMKVPPLLLGRFIFFFKKRLKNKEKSVRNHTGIFLNKRGTGQYNFIFEDE